MSKGKYTTETGELSNLSYNERMNIDWKARALKAEADVRYYRTVLGEREVEHEALKAARLKAEAGEIDQLRETTAWAARALKVEAALREIDATPVAWPNSIAAIAKIRDIVRAALEGK